MKKSPANFTDEELLKLLEEIDDDSEPELTFDSSVLSFVYSFNLKPGKDPIIKKQLYNLYRLWNKGIHKLSQIAFTSELAKFFDHKGNFYLIDKSLLTIADFIQKEKAKHKTDKSKSKHYQQHFSAFLNDTELESGTVFIELEIMYFLYLQWRRAAKKTTTLGRKQFVKILDIHFEVKAIAAGNYLWVGVNESVKNLITKQEVERWRRTRDKKNKRYYYPQEEWRQFALYWEEKNK